MTAPTNVASCGTVTNVVSVEAGNEPGSAGENNTAEASVTITCPPDKPGEPGDPDNPGKPGDPDKPGKPSKPGKPDKPVKTLPTTGTGDGAGSAFAPVWALIAAAIVAMAGAVALRITPVSRGQD